MLTPYVDPLHCNRIWCSIEDPTLMELFNSFLLKIFQMLYQWVLFEWRNSEQRTSWLPFRCSVTIELRSSCFVVLCCQDIRYTFQLDIRSQVIMLEMTIYIAEACESIESHRFKNFDLFLDGFDFVLNLLTILLKYISICFELYFLLQWTSSRYVLPQ